MISEKTEQGQPIRNKGVGVGVGGDFDKITQGINIVRDEHDQSPGGHILSIRTQLVFNGTLDEGTNELGEEMVG